MSKGEKDSYNGLFYLTKIKKDTNNKVCLNAVECVKNSFMVSGSENQLIANNTLIDNSKIAIYGTNNRLILHDGVKLRKADIIIRGSNNVIEIGQKTTFGGVRIINVGENNSVSIGKDCLFADHIEIWASDSHSILDDKNKKINPEKPINIGDKVWVGSRVIILKGVTVNSGAIIGMGSIITKDVVGKSITIGPPNKVLKKNVSWTIDY